MLYMTVGLPASGKSTWAKQFVRANPGMIRFNNDELSYMVTGWDDGRSFEPMDNGLLRKLRSETILYASDNGRSMVLDNTNLSGAAHREARRLYKGHIFLIEFRVGMRECIRRNDLRGNPVSNDVIRSMADRAKDRYPWVMDNGPGNVVVQEAT